MRPCSYLGNLLRVSGEAAFSGPATPRSLTLSRPMWMSSLVRKVLELNDEELKAFFMRASKGAEMERGRMHAAGEG